MSVIYKIIKAKDYKKISLDFSINAYTSNDVEQRAWKLIEKMIVTRFKGDHHIIYEGNDRGNGMAIINNAL